MSDPVSALKGARHAGLVEVRETGLGGMITLRGDLDSDAIKSAVKSVTGADVPALRKIALGDAGAAAWMSPDELLLLVDYAEADAVVAKLDEALVGTHYMATNVSDARACFSVSGEAAREVMGKLAPVDFSAAKFGAGDFRRSRLAQVAAAFWMDDAGAFHIVCFRSVGQYMFDLLKVASHPQSAVGVY
ncbi:sarcosine oxidase, gamma subunit family [Tritonibacter multivorans]|uniref:Sarcosine oxidase, gamma subunit family n=1 Tax=Tritonibacter multivorans TaxID=928856 RepID=A0A0P1GHL2_9RHOB|nr:sarcosine oxidase subunit gamma family protein [Tritonibacter multivorans]MDA7420509.1 sarcosine oxidase subunit gamma [Tritonibacter multivorans]CUH81458.1 sarcosine oxidase, gamma subunit family [Tritonibacter multivorans]SFC35846.1 sarcosine oxidase subunit gamma [Tritonibacter multivorans]